MSVHGEDSDLGVEGAVALNPVLAKGPSTAGGAIVSEPVAEADGLPTRTRKISSIAPQFAN